MSDPFKDWWAVIDDDDDDGTPVVPKQKSKPPYPYNKKTDTIHLPSELDTELRTLLQNKGKIQAVKRVMALTGAGLRTSKSYVDAFR